jgi:hypothetical protein
MPDRKTVLLATDGSTSIQLRVLVEQLNRVCKYLRFSFHPEPIDLGKGFISNPKTFKRLSGAIAPLCERHSAVFLATELRYDNNFFWDTQDSIIIYSFSGWSMLTNLPQNNGMIGFIYSALALGLDPNSNRHYENTGCLFDFMEDKRGVDAWLRCGVICRDCFAELHRHANNNPSARLELFDCTVTEGLEDLTNLLDEVSQASKREIDILARWETKAGVPQDFDVFLCHNSKDKPSVRKLYNSLIERGVSPWFDEEHLRPGLPWQRELEATIPRIKSAAVIVGPHGQGPWQDIELESFLREFARRGCALIPVLLEDSGEAPLLPLFLQAFTWVDFRKSLPDPWRGLIWGITGTRPI